MPLTGTYPKKLVSGRIEIPRRMRKILGSYPTASIQHEKGDKQSYPYLRLRPSVAKEPPAQTVQLTDSQLRHVRVRTSDQVVIIGVNDRAEIWKPDMYATYEKEQRLATPA
ncbi:hypothetical protein CL614_02420 [archaeon]|nr:hypothetical protein [archaeon]|tara:strand:- start:544 stop:876 length:333 start_codon:yes stop_codon:yes gene_type:complete